MSLIALTEANALRARAKRDGVRGVDSELPRSLRRNLPLSLRVMLDWSMKDADLDLFVTEPGGERVSIFAQRSASGGLLSNDMTDGYGPEVYGIRRGPDGRYVVTINAFSLDDYDGKVAPRARLVVIRDFGLESETRSTQLVDLSEEKGADVVLAEVVIGEGGAGG